jgi:hypothetical protein
MRTGNGSGIHMRAGLMASSVPLSPRLKLCLHCVEADRQQFGFRSSWRTALRRRLAHLLWVFL